MRVRDRGQRGRLRRQVRSGLLAAALVVAVVPAVAWPAAAAAASVVDVTVNIAGPAAAGAGAPFSYTVRIGNNSLNAADGSAFTVTMPSGALGVAAACAAANGAACPAPLSVSNATVAGTVPALPHLGEVTLTITGRFPVPAPSSETGSAHVSPPPGDTDSDPSSNDSSVSTAMNNSADLATTMTQGSPTISAGSPETYMVTYTDNGPAAADGAEIDDQLNWLTSDITGMKIHMVSCTAAGGAVCPALPGDTTITSGDFPVRTTTPTFPAGSTITVTFTADPVLSAPCVASGGSVSNIGFAQVPAGMTDPVGGNNIASLQATLAGAACPQADLTVTKTESSPVIGPGSPETYTVSYLNNGPAPADGASLFDFMFFSNTGITGMNIHMVSCTATGGAVCPALPGDTTIGSSDLPLHVTANAFPAGSKLVVVFTADPIVPSGCLVSGSSVTNTATIDLPAGVTDPAVGNNSASVTAGPSPVCPPADLSVTKSQSSPTIAPGLPDTYTLTFANSGPSSAGGAGISDYMPWDGTLITAMKIHVTSCTVTGGAVCPAIPADTTIGNDQFAFRLNVPTFPSGSSVTVAVRADPVPGTTGCGSPSTVTDRGGVEAPDTVTDPNGANDVATVTTAVACADISVNKAVDPAAAQAAQPVSFQVKVANSSAGAASAVLFSDPLPSGFVFGSAACSANSAASTCGPVSYDPATMTVSSTITTVGGNQDFVTITINGTAGPVPGTYANTATAMPQASGPDAFYDPNLASNTSTVSLQVFNTASAITVTKVLAGWPSGLPVAVRFTGQVTCGTQDAQPWQVTVPAGAVSASATPVTFYDGQACAITEDTPPDLPAGYAYAGPPVISPSGIALLGPSRSVQVTVTNPIAPVAQLTLAKTATPVLATAGGTVRYDFKITNTGQIGVSDVTVTETSFSGSGGPPAVSCPPAAASLAPQASVTCTATYTVTAADQAAGEVTNTATATGTPASGPTPVAGPATATVTVVAPPALRLVKTVEPAAVTKAGDTVTYRFTVTNTGGTDLDHITVTDTAFSGTGSMSPITCPAEADRLALTATVTCTARYTLTQADIDAGQVTNIATASGTPPPGFTAPVSNEATARVTAAPAPGIELVKSASAAVAAGRGALQTGRPVTYSFVVTNTGNVTLHGISIAETAFSGTGTPPAAACPAADVAPGGQLICTASYTVTQADVDTGTLTNTARADGITLSGDTTTSAPSTVTLPQQPRPALTLVKTAAPAEITAAGQQIHYTFEITNTGNLTLTGVDVTEKSFTGAGARPVPGCPGEPVTLLPGQRLTCAAAYTVTAADLGAETVSNTAVATGAGPGRAIITSPESTATDPVAHPAPPPPTPPPPPAPAPPRPPALPIVPVTG